MEHRRTQVFASELLASLTTEAGDLLLPIAIQYRSGPAASIATRLGYISDSLSRQELYQLSPNTQSLSRLALQDLVEICHWPTLSYPAYNHHLLTKTPQELHELLYQRFKNRGSKDYLQHIKKFCQAGPDNIRPFESRFIALVDELTNNEQELHGADHEIAAFSHLRPPIKDVYPEKVNQLLLDGVRSSAVCVPGYHGLSKGDNTHPTRLCLNSGFRFENQVVLFNIITATSTMTYWQEVAFNVPIIEKGETSTEDTKKHDSVTFDSSKWPVVKIGTVCRRLENPNYAKIYLDLDEKCNIYERPDPDPLQHIISGCGIQLSELLGKCELTIEHKIKLSYAIARAFWQFYSSELMNARWTSEDILFIPVDGNVSDLEGIPLRAFVPFPFGTQYKESPAEFCDKDLFTHRYPRILYLGIVLLEIGLGQPLGLERDLKLSLLQHTNIAHIKSKMKLKELKTAKWDGFQWKDYFVEAVENCLDSTNFRKSPKGQTHRYGDDESSSRSPPSERRDALYRSVVSPLYWLATVGFKDTEEVPMVRLSKTVRQTQKSKLTDDEEIQSFWNNIREIPSFSSDGGSGTPKFLEDLQLIAGHILRCRRKAKVVTPIRVAILDTGCKREIAYFQDPQCSRRFKGWKDFTNVGSESETDTFGHGSYMTRLLMHVAPIVDIYLVRVAENGKDLEGNQQSIGKAIEHAGLDPDWKVDVISMSFGFPRQPYKAYSEAYPVISDAIDKVRKKREGRVLFLASAGNSWERTRAFPACHQDVIPIYAGDSKGQFSKSTPAQTGKGPKKLGTYGTDIPSTITEEVGLHFPTADLSTGTSIATAIAAGIVAMTLSYIAALPAMLQCAQCEQVCTHLYTKEGMEQMLYSMSLHTNYRQHFINPVWFWGQKQRDWDFWVSMCSAVERMNEE